MQHNTELAALRQRALDIAKKPFDADVDRLSRNEDVLARISELTNTILEPIAKCLSADFEIVSLRVRYGRKGVFLRPLHTSPRHIHNYFIDPTRNRNFSFSSNSFVGGIPLKLAATPRDSAIYLYKLSELEANTQAGAGFPGRIVEFMKNMSNARLEIPGGLTSLNESGFCLLAGRADVLAQDISEPFHEFLALYGTPKGSDWQKFSSSAISSGEYISSLITILFDAIDVFEQFDRERFQLEGLEIVSSLVSTFIDGNESPAFKVAILLENLQSLLQRHLLGGASQTVIDNRGNDASSIPWVRFVNINYKGVRGRGLLPDLSVYPRDIARRNPVGAFLLSHPNSRSIVKFLLHIYGRHHPRVNFERSFSELFSAIELPFDALIHDNQGTVRGIVLSADDVTKKQWSELCRDVSPDELGTLSVAAFLIGSSIASPDDPQMPIGVLAFESALPDAFSKDDIRFLTSLAKACAPLIQSLNMGYSHTDFRSAVKNSFEPLTGKQIAGESFGRYVFELVRMDGDLLRIVASSEDPAIASLTGLTVEQRRDYFVLPLGEIINTSDEEAQAQSFEVALNKRHSWILQNQDLLIDLWSGPDLEKIRDFLENVPSNLMWYSYLSSIPRAIADREFDKSPIFSLFAPGFSALAIFVLNNRDEMQQIIKLSPKAKILDERDRYRRHVRYKVPLAARLPLSAFAFETSGKVANGIELSTDGYGALVSDLVGGGADGQTAHGRPFSLLDQCCRLIQHPDAGGDEIVDAVVHHFGRNTDLWKTIPQDLSWDNDEGSSVAIRRIARVDQGVRPAPVESAKQRLTVISGQWIRGSLDRFLSC